MDDTVTIEKVIVSEDKKARSCTLNPKDKSLVYKGYLEYALHDIEELIKDFQK